MHCFSISQLYFGKKLYMFQTVLLSIISSLNTVFTAISICYIESLKIGKITAVYTCTVWLGCETCCG
jgi:hypothetical protein